MIRKATLEDLPTLLELEKVCFRTNPYRQEQIEWFLSTRKAVTFLSIREDRAVGSVMMSIGGSQGKVVSIGVHPDWRGKGVAKELMKVADKWFTDFGVTEIGLEVSVQNPEAIRLYSSLGFEVARTLKSYYSRNEDAFYMRKEIPKVE